MPSERIYLERKDIEFIVMDPKGSELWLKRVKPPETAVEARRHSNAQIDAYI